jgi:hypothetical protein
MAGRCGRVEFFFKKVWGTRYAVCGGFFNHEVTRREELNRGYTEGRGTELYGVLIK